MSSPANSKDSAGSIKDLGRDGRLSFRNFTEHQLRKEFKQNAMEKECDLPIRAFAECGKEEGLMVVFRCREFQQAANECMAVYNSDERFELYKEKHMAAALQNK